MPKIEKEYHDFVIKAERRQQLQNAQNAQNANLQLTSGQNAMKPSQTKYGSQQPIQNKFPGQHTQGYQGGNIGQNRGHNPHQNTGNKYFSQGSEQSLHQKHIVLGVKPDQMVAGSFMNQGNPNQPSNYPPSNKTSQNYANKSQSQQQSQGQYVNPIVKQRNLNDLPIKNTSIINNTNNINKDDNKMYDNSNTLNILYGFDDQDNVENGNIGDQKIATGLSALLNKDNSVKLIGKRKTSGDIREFESKMIKKKMIDATIS